MKSNLFFDPIRKVLFDDNGVLIKHVHCPLQLSWENLNPIESPGSNHRMCESCNHTVVDSAFLSPAEIIMHLDQDPKACLKISLEQSNIRVKIKNG